MLQAIVKVLRFAGFRDDFQVTDAPTNRHTELMGVNNARKESPTLLPGFRFGQQVLVSRKQGPVQSRSPVEEFVIRQFNCAVFLRSFDVHPAAG